MKKTLIIFTLFTFGQNVWSQSFTRSDFEQKEGKKLVRTTQVDIQDEMLSLTQNLLDEESGDIIWDHSKQWPLTYKKTGHIMGEHDKKQSTTISLIFTEEMLQQFSSEFDVDEFLRKAYKKAEKANKTKCSDGFTNYQALALETSKDFSEVFQAICFK